MSSQTSILLAKWIGGALAYFAVSLLVARTLAVPLKWGLHGVIPMLVKFETRMVLVRVFVVCLFWGALYASAFARPAAFGNPARIWKHLGLSYILSLAACAALICEVYLPYPSLESNFALSSYPFLVISLAMACFLAALATWVQLAFGSARIAKEGEDAAAHS